MVNNILQKSHMFGTMTDFSFEGTWTIPLTLITLSMWPKNFVCIHK